ncbi:MAG: acyltransferase [Lactobacillaceae bacterium]|jgi:serine/alanine racemase|nr:acyltransferase [Lactobacillaceae bacterium]
MQPKIPRKAGLDLFRIIGVILVILIHTEQTLPEQIIVDSLSGLVVPVFMIISAFFMFNNFDTLTVPVRWFKLKKSIKSLLLLFITWKLIYLAYDLITDPKTDFNLFIVVKRFLLGFFYGGSFGGSSFHLWFFSALIFGLLVTYYLVVNRKVKTLIATILIAYLLFGLISPILKAYGIRTGSMNISTLVGLIWVPLGALMAMYKQVWQKWNNNLVLVIAIAVTAVNFLIKCLSHLDVNFLMLGAAPFLFIYLLRLNINIKKINLVQLRNVSTLVYVLHILVMFFVKSIHLSQWFTFTFLITFTIAIITVFIGETLNSKPLKFLYGSK